MTQQVDAVMSRATIAALWMLVGKSEAVILQSVGRNEAVIHYISNQ